MPRAKKGEQKVQLWGMTTGLCTSISYYSKLCRMRSMLVLAATGASTATTSTASTIPPSASARWAQTRNSRNNRTNWDFHELRNYLYKFAKIWDSNHKLFFFVDKSKGLETIICTHSHLNFSQVNNDDLSPWYLSWNRFMLAPCGGAAVYPSGKRNNSRSIYLKSSLLLWGGIFCHVLLTCYRVGNKSYLCQTV